MSHKAVAVYLPLNSSFRVLREVEGIKCEALNLKEQMQMVKDDIRRVCEILYFSVVQLIKPSH